jgi:hypothetical protein
LVKELRLAVVRSLAEGNALLPGFIPDYNAHFTKTPANKKDLHRPPHADDDLEDAFAWKEERALSQALTLQYEVRLRAPRIGGRSGTALRRGRNEGSK